MFGRVTIISHLVKGLRSDLLSTCNYFRSEICRRYSCLLSEYRSVLPKAKVLAFDVPCSLKIKPLDPQLLLEDCIVARAYGPLNNQFTMKLLEREERLVFVADYSHQQDVGKTYLEVEIPVRCDIDVVSKLGDVSVESLVSDNVSVEAEDGDVYCRKLTSATLHLKSSVGNINCEGTLLGNIKIKAGKLGSVRGANFQGNLLEIETDDGDIVVSSTYSDKSFFTAKNGSVSLKNLHRKSCVTIHKGNLSISGLDGSLDARVDDGNIGVQVAQLNADSYMKTENGNVSLRLAKDNVCQLDLHARKILILAENICSTGKIEPSCNGEKFRSFPRSDCSNAVMKVDCKNGEVHVGEESWITSLNIGGYQMS